MERCDRWLDQMQVDRVLGLLDLCDVEQLPCEESNRIRIPMPRGLAELNLGILQDKEFLRLGPWVTNHAYSVVTHLKLARGDSEHGLCKHGGDVVVPRFKRAAWLGVSFRVLSKMQMPQARGKGVLVLCIVS